jgi:SOS-response transcriptional repressor LexA
MTPKQKQCLDFIRGYWTDNGYAPSFDEMRIGLALKSKGSIAGLVANLEERGYLERIPNLARSIRLVDAAPPPPETPRPSSIPVLPEPKVLEVPIPEPTPDPEPEENPWS